MKRTPTETIKVKQIPTELHVFQQLRRFPRETPQRVLLESLCSRRDHAKGSRDFYFLRGGTWRLHRYSRAPSMIAECTDNPRNAQANRP